MCRIIYQEFEWYQKRQINILESQQVCKTGLIITKPKAKCSLNDFFTKCDQTCRKLRIWSHLLTKSLMENFIFCAVIGFMIHWTSIDSIN